jgi:hypothetical protein
MPAHAGRLTPLVCCRRRGCRCRKLCRAVLPMAMAVAVAGISARTHHGSGVSVSPMCSGSVGWSSLRSGLDSGAPRRQLEPRLVLVRLQRLLLPRE